MNKKRLSVLIIIAAYAVFISVSFLVDFTPGKEVAGSFMNYSSDVFIIFPFVFILIGLFEVWVKRETVERHLGKQSGVLGYALALVLGGMTLGPMIIALPIARAIHKKGARLSVVFTYMGAAAVCRIPMTVFEASYLGGAFTAIRYTVSIPLIIGTSMIIGSYLEKRAYGMNNNSL